MDMTEISLEIQRSTYKKFAILCNVLEEFSINDDVKTRENLMAIAKSINIGLPLPSGRYGNVLAVALEMQFYQGALFMIKNADELEIDLTCISSEFGGNNAWDAQQTFELSQLGFNKTKIAENDEFYKEYPWLIKSKNSNIDAALEISDILQNKTKSKQIKCNEIY